MFFSKSKKLLSERECYLNCLLSDFIKFSLDMSGYTFDCVSVCAHFRESEIEEENSVKCVRLRSVFVPVKKVESIYQSLIPSETCGLSSKPNGQ